MFSETKTENITKSAAITPLLSAKERECQEIGKSLESENAIQNSNDVAIRVRNVSKRYELYSTPRDRLKQFVIPKLQRMTGLEPRHYFEEFWALKDITFDLHQGETIGIVGKNGAGKSTLLQIICGTLSPTTGSVTVNGRVAALLELGSGFNPDFTGVENIYFNGSLLGLSKNEMEARFEEICAFADIGEFIYQPVKHYSSGMLARLAFAVSINVDPQILIVDEALSVGDSWFQHKSMARMRKLMEAGTTVLFVSHSIDAVRSLCQRAVWLEHGNVKMIGTSNDVTNKYMNEVFVEHNRIIMESLGAASSQPIGTTAQPNADQIENDQIEISTAIDDMSEPLSVVVVEKVVICDRLGYPTDKLAQGEPFSVVIKIRCSQAVQNLSAAILIKDQFGLELTGESVFNKYRKSVQCGAGQKLSIKFSSVASFRGGQSYSVSVRVNSVSRWDRSDNVLLWADETAAVFDVLIDQNDPMWFKFRQDFKVEIDG